METDVIVVGAGAAGLFAAREIARSGRRVLVLEARVRPGGRIVQAAAPAVVPLELGPEFVHGRPEITYALLREAGTTVVDDAETSFARRDGGLVRVADDAFSAVTALLRPALERDDETVEALLARAAREGATTQVVGRTRALVAGFDAADPARASARAIAEEWAGDASADGAQSRPLGGYAPLVRGLLAGLDPACARVVYGAPVRRVACGDGVRVATGDGAAAHTYGGRCAILTVPLGVLQRPPAAGGIAFEPPLPERTRRALGGLAMGPVAKVLLLFRAPFWETLAGGRYRDGAFFSSDGPFPAFWTQLPLRAPLLTAWAGGPAAAALADREPDALVRLALTAAGDLFGAREAADEAFVAGYVHDWQRDEFAFGAYSYVVLGGADARAALAAPIPGGLFVAGEATASGAEGGTVAGALESGRRAAREALEFLGS